MRLTYYTVAAVAARLPLVRLISAVMPMIYDLIVRAAGLRRVLTGVCYSSSEPAFQKVAPSELLTNFVDRGSFNARNAIVTCSHVVNAFRGTPRAKGCLEFSNC
jgi:hypothetical protein